MVRKIEVRRIGRSLSAAVPEEVLEHLNLAEGDTLFVVPTDLGVLLTSEDPGGDPTMQAYERVRIRYDQTLRDLAS